MQTMKTISTNNWSYCLSKHLDYDNDLQIDERLCFVLASSLSLRLTPLKPHLDQEAGCKLSEMYLEPLNSLKVESFANNCCHEVAFIHDYEGKSKMEWIAKELIENKKKFLVSISCHIFPTHTKTIKKNDHLPIYAILSISENQWTPTGNFNDIKELFVELEIDQRETIVVRLGDFFKSWIVENELFNANRLAYLTVETDESKDGIASLIKTALLRQYHMLKIKDTDCNLELLKSLRARLENNTSYDDFDDHLNMLSKSFSHQLEINNPDMNRRYYAECLDYLGEMGNFKIGSLSKSFLNSSEVWKQAYRLILCPKKPITNKGLYDMYTILIEREELILQNFKKAIYQ